MLDTVPSYADEMLTTLMQWAAISSGSYDLEGLDKMAALLQEAFSTLTDDFSCIPLDNQTKSLLLFRKRRPGRPSILLGGHYDTVFSTPFELRKQDNRLVGPGVIDMKGGLVILLYALRLFEQSPLAEKLGWEVFLNPDEEIGSPASSPYLEQIAKHHKAGLLFEPAYPDGSYVSRRKASLSIKITLEGRSAHAGRDFAQGINAIVLLSSLLLEIHQWNDGETTINIGLIEGGEAINSVPQWAHASINIRAWKIETLYRFQEKLNILLQKYPTARVEQLSLRPPKTVDPKLYKELECAVRAEGLAFHTKESGGGSDGNNLSFAGLPVIDTMGAIGAEMHTTNEYLNIESLVQRTRIALRLLMHYAEVL